MYTDHAEITSENILYLAEAARAYKIPGLQHLCGEFLEKDLNPDTVLGVLHQGLHFDDQNLITKCLDVIAESASDVLKATEFEDLSNGSLAYILDIEKMNCYEVELFQACTRWAQAEVQRQNRSPDAVREMLDSFIPKFRFPTMSLKDFSEEVVSTKLLTANEVALTYQQIITHSPLQDTPLIFENRGKPVQYVADVILQGNRSTTSRNSRGGSLTCFVNTKVTLFKIHSFVALSQYSSNQINIVQDGKTKSVNINRQTSHENPNLEMDVYVLSPTMKLEEGYFTVKPSNCYQRSCNDNTFMSSPIWQKMHHGSVEWWCKSYWTHLVGFQYKITP